MARVYSHRRGSTQKKAKPVEAMYASTVSLASLVIYAVLISFSVASAGENTKWVGGFGILGLCVAIGSFVYNLGQMRTETDIKDRVICMSISSVVLFIWVATLIIGMFN